MTSTQRDRGIAGKRRRCWAKKALVCTTVLPLLVPSVIALRIPSRTPLLFISPSSCIPESRCSSTICYASKVEEETMQVSPSPPTDSSEDKQHTSDAMSHMFVKVDNVFDSTVLHQRNGHSHFNGYNQPADYEHPLEVKNGASPHVNGKTQPTTVRKLWQRRHARSIEEGVRHEKTQKTVQLSTILTKEVAPKRRYFARTISGLIHALAEEADGLDVDVDAQQGTPLWRKQVDAIRINFSRLGFKPLRMGGLDEVIRTFETQITESQQERLAENLELSAVSCPDEAFDRIDVDKSGALDPAEIAKALNLAAASDSDTKVLEELASRLVQLYDFNGDGVVDREEYQSLVADMATLRQEEKERQKRLGHQENTGFGLRGLFGRTVGMLWRKKEEVAEAIEDYSVDSSEKRDDMKEASKEDVRAPNGVVNISDDAAVNSVAKGGGSIVLSDLTLDLRQLLFGFVPVVKQITPGGPLILEPFTATVTASFNREDIMASLLLDAGLRRLVARALRRRVRSFRDLVDGAVFYGRTWNMASKSAPLVEVPELTSVEFDKENRIIMTGRAQVRTSPDAPFIENAFKVRTRIGTRQDGRCIRLEQPELAFVLECPSSWEKNIAFACEKLGMPAPARPKPLYSFFPIYSPFKVDDNDGFDLGEDNRIKSIDIKDGSLRFEICAVLRPGRFLGNHYLAFTIPQRTFIITMDRVREGIRAARRNKRAALAAAKQLASSARRTKGRNYLDAVAQSFSSQNLVADREKLRAQAKRAVVVPQPHGSKSFFSRFVDGYLGAGKDDSESHERLTIAISDWFGRQGANNDDDDKSEASNAKES